MEERQKIQWQKRKRTERRWSTQNYTTVKCRRTNNDLQNTTQNTKIRAKRTPLKTGGELMSFGRKSSSCSTRNTCRVTVKRSVHHKTEKKHRKTFNLTTWITRTSLIHVKNECELWCSGRVCSSCSTSDVCRITLV